MIFPSRGTAPIWIYIVATLAGGATAGFVFRALNPDDPGEPAATTDDATVPAARESDDALAG